MLEHNGVKYVSLEFAERVTQTNIEIGLRADLQSGIHLPPGEAGEWRIVPVLIRYTGA